MRSPDRVECDPETLGIDLLRSAGSSMPQLRSVARWTSGQVVPQRLNKQRLIELAYVADALAEVLPAIRPTSGCSRRTRLLGTASPPTWCVTANISVLAPHRRHGVGDLRVSDALDEELVQRIDARGTGQWSGTCLGYTGAHRRSLVRGGCRRFGGRWNPPLLVLKRSIWPIPHKRAWLKWNARCAGGINDPGEVARSLLPAAHHRRHRLAVGISPPRSSRGGGFGR